MFQILQAGRGLAYLHSQTPPMCHADIKPENVLVNDSKEAALSDFGLSRVLQSLDTRTGLTTSGGARGTHHYMAMELFAEDTPRATCESDVYAFGGLILRVSPGISDRYHGTNMCSGHEWQSTFRGRPTWHGPTACYARKATRNPISSKPFV